MPPKYVLTDEHRAQLPAWRDRWIANAMSTAAMTDEDRSACVDALRCMYEAAGKPWHGRVVFVPSPFVLRFAGGFAAAEWWLRKNNGQRQPATRDATYAATAAATDDATAAATDDATAAATRAATYAATAAATRAATYVATYDATPPNLDRWYAYSGDLRALAIALGIGNLGIRCAQSSYRVWQGGNQWSAWDSFLSFFRHVVGLGTSHGIDYSAYDAWETLALRSGPRIVHADFCMVSDRPELLTVDAENRPHNDTGPFCRWRDGSALYAIHGVRCPAWVIEHPERITVATIDAEQNAEIKRIMLERYGLERFLADAGAELLGRDRYGALYRRAMPGGDDLLCLVVDNSTPEPDGSVRKYVLGIHPECRPLLGDDQYGDPQPLTPRNAVASMFGLKGEDYRPEQET